MMGARWGLADFKRRLLGTTAACALALAAGVAVSQGAVAETLNQALGSAYKYNPRLDAERARLRATDEEVARAHAGFRPTISATGTTTFEQTNTRPDTSADGRLYPKGYSVNLTQPVFRGFRTINQLSEAEATVRAGRETLRSVEAAVMLEAVTAFVDVIRDQAIVKLRENNVTVLSRELKATQDRFAVGEVTRTDVAQAQARRAASVSALDLAKSNLKSSRAAFERVVGHAPGNLVPPPLTVKLVPPSLDRAIAISANESPTVVASLYREEAARYTIERIRGELLPEVSVNAAYTNNLNSSRNIEQTEQGSVTGRVTVPIYQGGEVHARVRQAKHTHVSRLQEVEQARSEVKAQVIAAWSRLLASKAQLESDRSQVQANRTALAGVREEERVGQRTLLDVLNAEQELLNSEVQLASTQRNVVVDTYALLSAIGRLNASEVTVASAVYDPEVHYQEVRRAWWGLSITHADGRRESVDLWDARAQDGPRPARSSKSPSK